MKNCVQCQKSFEIRSEDRAFLEKASPSFQGQKFLIPEPTHCPECREQRRLSFRNERNLYKRLCSLCQKSIVSVYSVEKPFPVYCSECWFSDRWESLSYGKVFDFSRPFFEQYVELMSRVPLLFNIVINSSNCEYNSFIVDSKDCYLSSRVGSSESIYYSYLSHNSRDSMDSMYLYSSELCYECIDCWNCYNVNYSQLCRNVSDSSFCYDCIGCKYCFGCVGLRNKEYQLFNKPVSKEEYEEFLKNYMNGSSQQTERIRNKWYGEVVLKTPQKALNIVNAENAIGNYIVESKNVYQSFDIEKTDGAFYTWGAEFSKDVMDGNFIYFGELCYEQISNSKSSNILFSFATITGNHDILSSMMMFNNCGNCFGSISLNHQQYCVLNTPYSKQEYEELMPKILEHLRETKEYGEFFPTALSPFAYNETFANDFYPLSKEEVLKRGWKWKVLEEKKPETPSHYQIPDRIEDVTDEILKQYLICERTGKPYKIIPQELEWYRKKYLPIPRLHPDERHRQRILKRNPRKLWERQCSTCQKSVLSSYSPERPESILCEACHQKSTY